LLHSVSEMVLKGSRILLVEDREDIRDVFTTLLMAEGAVVTAVATGRPAIERAKQEDFDVVLTDLGLPDIPGELVIREITKMSRPRPRIVAITGYNEPYLSRARAAGADTVLTKPVDWVVLLGVLRPDETATAVA
jgi:two-component system, chemotaxis family, CheB/CheR fusion protein